MSFEDAWRRCHAEAVAIVVLKRRLRDDLLFN
jgi:hypothetical protein